MKRKLLIILVTGILLAIGQLGMVPEANAHQIAAGDGTWAATGSMSTARSGQTQTLLRDGKVLVAGGYNNENNALASAELYDPRTGTWSPKGSMSTARSGQTATLLRDGKVLVAGGSDSHFNLLASAELYDPHTGTWSPTGSLPITGDVSTATLLQNGNVLVTERNYAESASTIAEVYNPRTGTWSPKGSISDISVEGATLLDNGNVLVTTVTSTTVLYNPRTATWSPTGNTLTGNEAITTTLLRNGKVLLTSSEQDSPNITQLYNPATGTWSQTGAMPTPLIGGATTLLPNGNVLLAGGVIAGVNNHFPATLTSTTEVYNPHTGTWSLTGSLLIPHSNTSGTLTLLPDGKVLIAGGVTYGPDLVQEVTNEAELYTPAC